MKILKSETLSLPVLGKFVSDLRCTLWKLKVIDTTVLSVLKIIHAVLLDPVYRSHSISFRRQSCVDGVIDGGEDLTLHSTVSAQVYRTC
jgi:hypothetical protein